MSGNGVYVHRRLNNGQETALIVLEMHNDQEQRRPGKLYSVKIP